MNNEPVEKQEIETDGENPAAGKVSGIGQMIIGELESIGGIITGDPTTHAEGEFNVAVGEERDDVEEELEEGTEEHKDK
ncbi:MAG: hypothetical protein ACR2N3_11515 [Pyrinomonadaceae bacterium]